MRRLMGAVAALVLCGCSEAPRPIPKETSSYYYGYITRGKAFGVSVGSTREAARATLVERKFEYNYEGGCDFALQQLMECTQNMTSDFYDAREMLRGRGTVAVIFAGDRVQAIAWDFNLLPYVDF